MHASIASVPELPKNDSTPPVDRRDRGQLLGQPHLRLVVEVGARHVQELLRLLGDGADDVGVRVAGGVDGDAGRAVEEDVAVHVLDHGARRRAR